MDNKTNTQDEATNNSSLARILGTASLVLSILGFIFSFVPCLGAYMFYVGLLSLGSGIGGLVLSIKSGQGLGLSIAGIVLSVLTIVVAGIQLSALSQIMQLK